MDKFADITKAVKEAKDKGIITSITDENEFRDQQRAVSGLSKEIHDYIYSLSKASGEQLTFSEVVKIGTMTLKENALAFIKSPFGIASIAVAGIYALVKVYDLLNVSLEESKEKLVELKSEYDSTASELSSLENEVTSVNERMKELEALRNSGTITLTEQEELEALEAQNAALARKIELLNLEQQIKQKEINKTFVETVDMDIGRTYYSSPTYDSYGNVTVTSVSEESEIRRKAEQYRQNLKELSDVESKYTIGMCYLF